MELEWASSKVLRGHQSDVYDLCWSTCCTYMVSGSIDNWVVLWDVEKGLAFLIIITSFAIQWILSSIQFGMV